MVSDVVKKIKSFPIVQVFSKLSVISLKAQTTLVFKNILFVIFVIFNLLFVNMKII